MAGFHGLGRSPGRRCMPLAEWPYADRERWLAAIRTGDIFDEAGLRAGHRPVSNRKMELGYGRFLTFLHRRGALNGASALDAITRDTLVRYVAELREHGNASATVLGRLQELHDTVSAICPARDWSWIREISSWVRANTSATNDKRRKMVEADTLLALGLDLMKSAKRMRTQGQAAIEFRDGLLIALLALRPMRLRNLTGLELGRTLQRIKNSYRIVFEGHAMKNGVPFEAPWPELLLDPLQEWLERHRPILAAFRGRWAREIGGAVWVSSHGSPISKQAIYDRIRARTAEAFGTPINPHLFRDIAATTLAVAAPQDVRLAAPLLSHTNLATTERYYIQASALKASARYQAQVLRLRRHTRYGAAPAPDPGEAL